MSFTAVTLPCHLAFRQDQALFSLSITLLYDVVPYKVIPISTSPYFELRHTKKDLRIDWIVDQSTLPSDVYEDLNTRRLVTVEYVFLTCDVSIALTG